MHRGAGMMYQTYKSDILESTVSAPKSSVTIKAPAKSTAIKVDPGKKKV